MSNNEQDKRFTKVLTDFENGGEEDESHADAHKAIFDMILQSERARRGVDEDPERWAEVDAETIGKISTSDTDDPRLVLAEKALKRIVVGVVFSFFFLVIPAKNIFTSSAI